MRCLTNVPSHSEVTKPTSVYNCSTPDTFPQRNTAFILNRLPLKNNIHCGIKKHS